MSFRLLTKVSIIIQYRGVLKRGNNNGTRNTEMDKKN